MKLPLIAVATLAAALAAGVAHTETVDAKVANELLKKSGCVACHARDKKGIGPAHLEVANKYRGRKDAEDILVKAIVNGGSGVWGPIPMPPHKHLAEADIRKMVRYILTYK